jgi:DNA-binding MarR family transcriptional regulator
MDEGSQALERVNRLADIILSLQRCFILRLSEELSKGEISFPQFFLLMHLAEGKPLSITDIAARMEHTTAAATGLVDRLESLGYAKRFHCPEDRRKVHVEITKSGLVFYNRVREGMIKKLSEMMEHLSPTERKMWLQIYEKIYSLCESPQTDHSSCSK